MAENKKVIISIVVDDKSAKKNLNEVEKSTKKAGESAKKANKNFFGLGKTLGAIARGFVIVKSFQLLAKAVTESVKILADFELAMAKVKAITGATDKEFAKLEKSAQDLALGTMFTATQVAELQLAYSKLGFTTQEILAATDATTKLATITGDDLANSADVVGSVIRGFNLDANEAARVVDVMAESFTSSALNLENFKQSMKTVAPIANSANISLEQTTAMLGVLADSGLRGTRAATGLKNLMSQLSSPTSKLAQELGYTVNNSEGLAIAFEDLKKKNIDLAKATGLTDERSKAAFLTLLNGKEKVDKLTESLRLSGGAAHRQSEIIEDTLSVSWDKFKSALSGFILREGDGITSFFQTLLDNTTDYINELDRGYRIQQGIRNIEEARNKGLTNTQVTYDKLGESISESNQEIENWNSNLEVMKQNLADGKITYADYIKQSEGAREVIESEEKAIKRSSDEIERRERLLSSPATRQDQIKQEIAFAERDLKIALEKGKQTQDLTDQLEYWNSLLTEQEEATSKLNKTELDRQRLEKDWEEDAKHFEKWSDEQVKARIKIRELDAKMIDNIGLREKALIDAAKKEKAEMMKTFQFQEMSADEKLLLEKQLDAKIANLEKAREDRIRNLQDQNLDDYEKHLEEKRKLEDEANEKRIAKTEQIQDEVEDLERKILDRRQELFNVGFDLLQVQLDNRLGAIQRANEQELNDFERLQNDKASRFDIEMKHQLDSFVGTEQQKADFEKQKSLEQLEFQQRQEAERDKLRQKQLAEENKIAKASFRANKINSLANIAIDTAKAVAGINANPIVNADITQALRTTLTQLVTGIGIAQGAVVASQRFQPKTFQDGGMIQGESHANGGVPFTVAGQAGFEAEGGEYIFSRKTVNRLGVDFLDSLNFGQRNFADGGFVAGKDFARIQAESRYAFTGQMAGVQIAELARVTEEKFTELSSIVANIRVTNVATDTAEVSSNVLNAQAMATL
jgi:TP901 family phage tail tape measure protein